MIRGTDLEKLEDLLPYAKEFVIELENLSQYPQSEHLHKIAASLNDLVESNIRHSAWSRYMQIDFQMQNLIESLERLKDLRNLIIHHNKEFDYERYMSVLKDLYIYGRDIDRMIERAIAILEEER